MAEPAENITPDPGKQGGEGTPAPAAGAGQPDVAKLSEEIGRYKKVAEEYESYRQKVDPVLETLWSDQELLNKATEAHNKRLGKAPITPPDDKKPDDGKGQTPVAPVGDPDVRNSQINMISSQFEDKRGISKLSDKEQEQVRGAVGSMLKEMLDPKGNKTIAQVFEEVSLTKLPWYLDKAYDLISKDSQIKAAEERGKQSILSQYEGDRGSIGSVVGGSAPIDDVVLTPQERSTAAKMGVSDDDYLKSKKSILQARNA